MEFRVATYHDVLSEGLSAMASLPLTHKARHKLTMDPSQAGEPFVQAENKSTALPQGHARCSLLPVLAACRVAPAWE